MDVPNGLEVTGVPDMLPGSDKPDDRGDRGEPNEKLLLAPVARVSAVF